MAIVSVYSFKRKYLFCYCAQAEDVQRAPVETTSALTEHHGTFFTRDQRNPGALCTHCQFCYIYGHVPYDVLDNAFSKLIMWLVGVGMMGALDPGSFISCLALLVPL